MPLGARIDSELDGGEADPEVAAYDDWEMPAPTADRHRRLSEMISRFILRIRSPLALAIAISAILSGCIGTGSATTIDGFTLGVMAGCSTPVGADAAALDRSCAGYQKRAMAALDAREPGHLAIASYRMYSDGSQPGPIDVTGDAPVPTSAPRHPGPTVIVFVFTLTDGSTRATGVACTEGGPCVGVSSYPR